MSLKVQEKVCPIFAKNGDITIVEKECLYREGCPSKGYASNELYKYPSCINTSLGQELISSAGSTSTTNFQESSSEPTRIVYDNSVSNAVFLDTTAIIQNVYTTNFPPKGIDTAKFITVIFVCGTTVLINALVVIVLITTNGCIKRHAMGHDMKVQFKHCRRVIEMEENTEYCEVLELDSQDRNDLDNNFLTQHGIEELRNKNSDADEINGKRVSIDDADNQNEGNNSKRMIDAVVECLSDEDCVYDETVGSKKDRQDFTENGSDDNTKQDKIILKKED